MAYKKKLSAWSCQSSKIQDNVLITRNW
jgi:hypothetical protein